MYNHAYIIYKYIYKYIHMILRNLVNPRLKSVSSSSEAGCTFQGLPLWSPNSKDVCCHSPDLIPHRPLDWGQLKRKWLKCMCIYDYMYLYIMSIKIYTHIRPSCCRTNQFCRKNINTHIKYIAYKYRVCCDAHFEDVTCITVKTFVPKKTLNF